MAQLSSRNVRLLQTTLSCTISRYQTKLERIGIIRISVSDPTSDFTLILLTVGQPHNTVTVFAVPWSSMIPRILTGICMMSMMVSATFSYFVASLTLSSSIESTVITLADWYEFPHLALLGPDSLVKLGTMFQLAPSPA